MDWRSMMSSCLAQCRHLVTRLDWLRRGLEEHEEELCVDCIRRTCIRVMSTLPEIPSSPFKFHASLPEHDKCSGGGGGGGDGDIFDVASPPLRRDAETSTDEESSSFYDPNPAQKPSDFASIAATPGSAASIATTAAQRATSGATSSSNPSFDGSSVSPPSAPLRPRREGLEAASSSCGDRPADEPGQLHPLVDDSTAPRRQQQRQPRRAVPDANARSFADAAVTAAPSFVAGSGAATASNRVSSSFPTGVTPVHDSSHSAVDYGKADVADAVEDDGRVTVDGGGQVVDGDEERAERTVPTTTTIPVAAKPVAAMPVAPIVESAAVGSFIDPTPRLVSTPFPSIPSSSSSSASWSSSATDRSIVPKDIVSASSASTIPSCNDNHDDDDDDDDDGGHYVNRDGDDKVNDDDDDKGDVDAEKAKSASSHADAAEDLQRRRASTTSSPSKVAIPQPEDVEFTRAPDDDAVVTTTPRNRENSAVSGGVVAANDDASMAASEMAAAPAATGTTTTTVAAPTPIAISTISASPQWTTVSRNAKSAIPKLRGGRGGGGAAAAATNGKGSEKANPAAIRRRLLRRERSRMDASDAASDASDEASDASKFRNQLGQPFRRTKRMAKSVDPRMLGTGFKISGAEFLRRCGRNAVASPKNHLGILAASVSGEPVVVFSEPVVVFSAKGNEAASSAAGADRPTHAHDSSHRATVPSPVLPAGLTLPKCVSVDDSIQVVAVKPPTEDRRVATSGADSAIPGDSFSILEGGEDDRVFISTPKREEENEEEETPPILVDLRSGDSLELVSVDIVETQFAPTPVATNAPTEVAPCKPGNAAAFQEEKSTASAKRGEAEGSATKAAFAPSERKRRSPTKSPRKSKKTKRNGDSRGRNFADCGRGDYEGDKVGGGDGRDAAASLPVGANVSIAPSRFAHSPVDLLQTYSRAAKAKSQRPILKRAGGGENGRVDAKRIGGRSLPVKTKEGGLRTADGGENALGIAVIPSKNDAVKIKEVRFVENRRRSPAKQQQRQLQKPCSAPPEARREDDGPRRSQFLWQGKRSDEDGGAERRAAKKRVGLHIVDDDNVVTTTALAAEWTRRWSLQGRRSRICSKTQPCSVRLVRDNKLWKGFWAIHS